MRVNYQRIGKITALTLLGVGLFAFAVVWVFSDANLSSAQGIPEHLQLKADKSRVLGSLDKSGGEVKYAYRSDVRVNNDISPNATREAQKTGSRVIAELVGQRTKHSKTFSTNRPNQYITEVISGEPQYYKDESGDWWHAEYATTTEAAFDTQMAQSLGQRIFSFFKISESFATESTFYPGFYGPAHNFTRILGSGLLAFGIRFAHICFRFRNFHRRIFLDRIKWFSIIRPHGGHN